MVVDMFYPLYERCLESHRQCDRDLTFKEGLKPRSLVLLRRRPKSQHPFGFHGMGRWKSCGNRTSGE